MQARAYTNAAICVKRMITILLADGSPNIYDAVNLVLEKLVGCKPYELLHATTVQGALGHLERHKLDLIIMEIHLRDRSGLSLLVQARKKAPNLPIIVMTSFTDLVTKEDLALLGAKYFFQKPPDMQVLRHTIAHLLQNYSAEGAPEKNNGNAKS